MMYVGTARENALVNYSAKRNSVIGVYERAVRNIARYQKLIKMDEVDDEVSRNMLFARAVEVSLVVFCIGY